MKNKEIMEHVEKTYTNIIKQQLNGQLTGEEFIQLKELQKLLAILEEYNKEYRSVVEYKMSI